MRQLSQNALGVQEQNAQLKEAQKQQALSALQQLYGIDTGAALNYLNSSTSALGTENAGSGLKNSFWEQYALNAQNNAGKVAGATGA